MPKVFRIVAWLQIVAGVAVAAYGLLLVFSSNQAALVASLLGVLGVLSVSAGVILLKASTLGWRGSVILQVLQIPAFSFGIVLYRLGLGAFLTVGVRLPDEAGNVTVLANFGVGADFAAFYGYPVSEQYLGINVVALILLMALLRSRPSDKLGKSVDRSEPRPTSSRH